MATLTTSVNYGVTINGKLHGNTIEKSYTNVEQVYHQVVNVSTSIQELVGFASTEKAGDIADDKLKFMAITNLDATNFVTLSFTTDNASASVADSAGFKLLPGTTFIITDDDIAVGTAPASLSLTQLDGVYGLADTAACQLEIFIGATA